MFPNEAMRLASRNVAVIAAAGMPAPGNVKPNKIAAVAAKEELSANGFKTSMSTTV
jgi:hypothetical protein